METDKEKIERLEAENARQADLIAGINHILDVVSNAVAQAKLKDPTDCSDKAVLENYKRCVCNLATFLWMSMKVNTLKTKGGK
jgi:hypothetical protein